MPRTCFALGTVLLFAIAPAAGADEASARDFFESKVRQILVESCIRCHGDKKQSSGLRLDSRAAIVEGGENGPAVVPGDPEKSLLVQAVRHTHEEIRMPPKGKLPEPAIAAIVEWVKQGAEWPEGVVLAPTARDSAAENHWGFQPLRDVLPPTVKDPRWASSPIDAFILAKLEAEGLHPSPRADKRTLIRRATFDLTGLPPTAEEIDAFEADTSPEAFARVVDRLLGSPRYGERWGRHWLDVARYADTKGYVFQEERRYPYAYTYRDYVVRAFNDDLPYDQFIVEQIAADRLPQGGDPSPLAALGFLTVGRRFLNNQQDIIDDRIDVVTRGLLGLTVACARCHDHKFDPIPTDDYYSLYGVFASSVEPADPPMLPASAPNPRSGEYERELRSRQTKADEFLESKRQEIQADLRRRVDVYLVAAFDLDFNPRNPKLDDRARADKLPPGRLRLAITLWKSHLEKTRDTHDPVFGLWHAYQSLPAAEFKDKGAGTLSRLEKETAPPSNPIVLGEFKQHPPTDRRDVVRRYAAILARATSEKAGSTQSEPETSGWQALREVVDPGKGALRVEKDGLSRVLDRAERDRARKLARDVAALAATHPGAPPRAMVLNDSPNPTDPHVFIRGNPGRPGKAVPRQFLKLLAGPGRKPFRDGSGRLELARAIADPRNPLAPRVIVNRVWMLHFGTGLVSTPSDFGLRSDPPSHPELLDFLAAQFIHEGWSIKTLHRRIMLSSAYQQQGTLDAVSQMRDPANRLLWRFPRRRLEFESMRDSLLAVSGRLDESIGGRPVPLADPPFPTRRTLYGFIDRQNLDGVYRTFDFASPDATSPRRFVTTVPQQALFLMNSPFVIEQAQELARKLGPEEDAGSRVRTLYRRIYGRSPTPQELELGVRFVEHATEDGPGSTPVWQYGFGRFDESTRRVARFEPFPHWTGKAWQFGLKLPHSEQSYLHVTASGGHVGPDAAHSAIWRWTAPRDMTVAVDGELTHDSEKGDGVRGRIVASRSGDLGEWVAHHAKVASRVESYEVKSGETIDFVVDCRSEHSFDSFSWSPVVREVGGMRSAWNARADFHGPAAPHLSAWEEYAQVLLLTNEFMFVD